MISSTPTIQLREFQQLANDKVHACFTEYQRVLGVAPTGSGKAVMSASLIQDCLDQKGAFVCSTPRALLLVNREELLQQGADKITKVTGKYAAIERGKEKAPEDAPIVVATIQSMIGRLARYPQDHFGLVIVDEAHLFATKQAHDVLDWFCKRELGGEAYLVGVTATPQTTGKRALAKVYDTIAYDIPLPELVKKGMLCNIKVRTAPLPIDLRHIRRVGGDFDEEELDAAVRPFFRAAAESMQAYGPDRKWLCFLPLIKTSEAFAKILNEHGIPAKHIDGASEDRKDILMQFKHDHFRALCCSSLLTTGYDEPSITGIVNLRPTQSRILLTQILGRGTRIKPPTSAHEDLLVLDFLWQYELGKIISPATLVAPQEEDEAEVSRRLRSGDELDLLETSKNVAHERHAALARKLAEKEKRQSKVVDLRQLIELGAEEDETFLQVLDYESTMGWHSKAPTEKQLHALDRFGIAKDSITDRGHASMMLDFLFERVRKGLASFRQIGAIKKLGGQADLHTTFAEASIMMGNLVARRG
jgi:superfamily II DNA or RNA helicase